MGLWNIRTTPKTKWISIAALILCINAFAPVSILNPNFFHDSKKKIKNALQPHFSFQKSSFNPKLLRHIPNAEDMGIVLDTFLLEIQDSPAPYNPSVIAKNDTFEIFYREDVIKNQLDDHKMPYSVFIKRAQFSEDFEQTAYSATVDLGTNSAEDPRIITHEEKEFIVFNDFYKTNSPSHLRSMFVADLHADSQTTRRLDFGLQKVEKNWTPFIYNNELHFIYKIDPFKVLRLEDGSLSNVQFLDSNLEAADLSHWKWGELRGGTPAVHIGDEYLAFFHSYFCEQGRYFYVAGAYTFSDTPPFRLKKVSRIPLKFPQMYSAPLRNTADPNKRVLYPSSLVLDKNPKQAYLFCGENDSAIRVIKINVQALLSSMIDLDAESEKKLKLKTALTLN